jgi:hypothetical protein
MSWLNIVFYLIVIAGLTSCEAIKNALKPEPTIDPCDPAANLYDKEGKHYVDRDFLRDDGTLDYKRYFRMQASRETPCDPLK